MYKVCGSVVQCNEKDLQKAYNILQFVNLFKLC